MKREVYKLSFSAFFADLGYMAVMSFLPLLITVYYHLSPAVYGIIEAINYGGGAVMSFLGGVAADRYGRRLVGSLGNSLIALMSFSGIVGNPLIALVLIAAGWWARNFRSPARRALVSEVTTPDERKRAFGILHTLDQTGAFLAIIYISLVLFLRLPVQYALLGTIIPLAISTLLIAITKTPKLERKGKTNVKVVVTVTISTLFFGFTFFSFGFPVISVAELTHQEYLGTLAFAIFSGTSALSALIYGRSKVREITGLAFLGYGVAAIASFGFALTYNVSLALLYAFSALMGIAVGAIETFEPSIISKFTSSEKVATGMGTLSLGRALGISISNLVMGFLYVVSPLYSYSFAGIMTIIASLVVLTIRKS